MKRYPLKSRGISNMSQLKSRIDVINLQGGIIGALLTNPLGALRKRAALLDDNGYRIHQVLPHRTTNLLMAILQIVVLALTLGLWTFGAGYIVVSHYAPDE